MAMIDWEKQEAERKQKAKDGLLELIPRLKEAGVSALFGFYDGSGDDGQVDGYRIVHSGEEFELESRSVWDFNDPSAEDLALIASLGDLDDLIWALAPDGFENNEGGFGAIALLVDEGKVRRNFSIRVESSEEDDTPEL